MPDGWVAVPVELTGVMTNAMTDAIHDDLHNFDVWRSYETTISQSAWC
ncbi:hypothetical protein VB274_17750 [Enterobacter cloacae]|nr:hypothetical protein [Enterobacter cloacae]